MRWLRKKLTRKLEIGKRKIKEITVGLMAVGFMIVLKVLYGKQSIVKNREKKLEGIRLKRWEKLC